MSEWAPAEKAVWETSFRRIQSRFESLASSEKRTAFVLATNHSADPKPSSYPPSLRADPHCLWSDTVENIFTKNDAEKAIRTPQWDNCSLGCYPIIGDDKALNEIQGTCNSAGVLLNNSPPNIFDDSVDFRDQYPIESGGMYWVCFVFQLAWQQRRGTTLFAKQLVWAPHKFNNGDQMDVVRTLDEYKKSRIRQEPPGATEDEFVQWNPNPNDCWYSVIEDFAAASVAAIDLVIADANRPTNPNASDGIGETIPQSIPVETPSIPQLPYQCYELLEALDITGLTSGFFAPVSQTDLGDKWTENSELLCVHHGLCRSDEHGGERFLILQWKGAVALASYRLQSIPRDPENPKCGDSESPNHGSDFRSVNWFGTPFSFTVQQARAVQCLWEHWEQNTPDVGDETILAAIDHEAPPARLNVLFRDCPAWGTMIVQGATKGSHRLQEPTE